MIRPFAPPLFGFVYHCFLGLVRDTRSVRLVACYDLVLLDNRTCCVAGKPLDCFFFCMPYNTPSGAFFHLQMSRRDSKEEYKILRIRKIKLADIIQKEAGKEDNCEHLILPLSSNMRKRYFYSKCNEHTMDFFFLHIVPLRLITFESMVLLQLFHLFQNDGTRPPNQI